MASDSTSRDESGTEPKRDIDPPTYSAEQVRQGEIILRTRTRRAIFVAGLVAAVVIALIVQFVGS